MTRPNLVDLNLHEYQRGFCYYSFFVNLDRYNGRCNTLDNPSSRIYVPSQMEDVNFSVCDVIIEINELKTLRKHISCYCNVNYIVEILMWMQKDIQENMKCTKKIIFGILVHVLVKMVNI